MELYIHEDLSEPEKRIFEKHLTDCEYCSDELNRTREIVLKIEKITNNLHMPDWNKSWNIIIRNVKGRSVEKDFSEDIFRSSWKYAVAGSILIFLLGFFAGKFLFKSSFLEEASNFKSAQDLQYAIYEYFEDIKPFILDYSNYQPALKKKEDFAFDKVKANELLIKNRLLQYYVLRLKNRELQKLLAELEIILMEISDIGFVESDNLLLIKQLIKMKKTIYKLENLYLEHISKDDISGGKI